MTSLGERLRELRRSRKVSSEELGTALGVSGEAVRLWETDRRFPRKEFLERICEYFGVSYDYLMGITDIPNAEVDTYYRIFMNPDGPEAQEVKRNAAIAMERLKKYSALTEQHKQAVIDMIDMYYEKDKDK